MLFSAPMVRALLDGRKTQTRRAVKVREGHRLTLDDLQRGSGPYGKPGDRLWVKERHRFVGWTGDDGPAYVSVRYDADGTLASLDFGGDDFEVWVDRAGRALERRGATMNDTGNLVLPDGVEPPSRPSIHMPRWASRITLDVIDVRVERLQDISEGDARAEGIRRVTKDGTVEKFCVYDAGADFSLTPWAGMRRTAREAFADLWRSINGPDSWDANPWVWVVEFNRADTAGAP